MALERQLFAIQRAVASIGGQLDESDTYIDLMSGQKSDRPNFQKVVELIERKDIDVCVFYRIDRLGRDVGLLDGLAKMFEKTGVKAYVCSRQSFINWQDTEDWDYWMSASVDAAKESRKISARLRQAHEFNIYKGQSNFITPFGYLRNKDRMYAFNPEQLELAKSCVDLFFAHDGNCSEVAKQSTKLGKTWTTIGLKRWIKNPVLRGHTPRGFNPRNGVVFSDIEYNTHSDILITELQYRDVERLLQERSFYRGDNAKKQHYTLTGIMRCSCGATCTIMKSQRRTRCHFYVRCRAGESKFRDLPAHGGNLRYAEVESLLIDELVREANRIIDIALDDAVIEQSNPEILRLEAQIDQVKALQKSIGDSAGLLAQQINLLQQKIAAVNHQRIDIATRQELRDRLSVLNDRDLWDDMSEESRRLFFTWFVDRAVIDFSLKKVTVHLNSLLL